MIRTGTQRGRCDWPQFVIGFEWMKKPRATFSANQK